MFIKNWICNFLCELPHHKTFQIATHHLIANQQHVTTQKLLILSARQILSARHDDTLEPAELAAKVSEMSNN